MITLIDYGMGNLKSLANAFESIGARVQFASTPKDIESATKLVFPGVGNFGKAVEQLKKKGLDKAIKKSIQNNTPFLGICLGLQLLFEKSREAPNSRGLGIFKGEVLKFKGVKVPHIGWNQIRIIKQNSLFKKVKSKSFAYFMHSFYALPSEKKVVLAKTDYKIDFCSAVAKNNVFGVQFHPEKSGGIGLEILKNFIEFSC